MPIVSDRECEQSMAPRHVIYHLYSYVQVFSFWKG